MKIKEIWTNNDFKEMGWHDSKLYQIKFPSEDYKFVLFLDYIFKWVKLDNNTFKFWVSPCVLTFQNINNLKLNLDFENFLEICIIEIRREKIGLTPNGKMIDWRFVIETDRGNLKFNSTGYEMKVISQPVLIDEQYLGPDG